MISLKRLPLFISLSPLFAVLFVSAINLDQKTSVRLLTWKSPEIKIGLITGVCSTSAAVFTAILFSQLSSKSISLRRKVNINYKQTHKAENIYDYQLPDEDDSTIFESEYTNQYVKERDYRDPKPTVSVPFKIITKQQRDSDQLDERQVNDLYQSKEAYQERDNNIVYPNHQEEYEAKYDNFDNLRPNSDDWGESLDTNW